MPPPFSASDIWFILAKVPEGKVVTYEQLAVLAGAPRYARVVGNVLKRLPVGTWLPWHRVINSKGRSSFPEDSSRYQQQISLLEAEGIQITNGKLNLTQHQWHGEE